MGRIIVKAPRSFQKNVNRYLHTFGYTRHCRKQTGGDAEQNNVCTNDQNRRKTLSKRIVFTGACNSDRALANSFGAEMWHSAWPGDSIPDAIEAIQADGSPYLNVQFGMITEEADRVLRAAGRGFSAWTVNDEANLRRFLEMGISNITTRVPVLALKLRREIQGVQEA